MTTSTKNGLIPSKDTKNFELLLRDVEAKGYLDIELVYRLRQKESLGSVKQKIVRKIQQNESALCFEDLVRKNLGRCLAFAAWYLVALVVAADQPTKQCLAPNRLANTSNFSSDRWSQ
jgi:hypothetical protein